MPAYSITHLETISSTNDEMLARIRAGSGAPGAVIVAREQTRGRGRMGRQWVSAVGGLWFTAAMPLHGEHLGWAGMLAALAVCRALDEVDLRAGVKWPNDVVVNGKKLAGVLVEMVAGRDLAAVGVGLNVRNPLPQAKSERTQPSPDCRSAEEFCMPGHDSPACGNLPHSGRPSGAEFESANNLASPALLGSTTGALWSPTTVSLETSRDPDPWSLLEPILSQMDDLWRAWEAGSLADLHAAWSARDVSRDHPVKLVPDGPEGVAAGIDPTGALRVRLPDGRETRARAGELLFLDSTASQP